MGWIFHCAEQVAGVLQREVFEDGKHLWDSLCLWSHQGREGLQQRPPGWAKGWIRVRGGLWGPQTPGHPCGVPIPGRSCSFGAHGTDAVEATGDLCGFGMVARTLDPMATFLPCTRPCPDLHPDLHSLYGAKTH